MVISLRRFLSSSAKEPAIYFRTFLHLDSRETRTQKISFVTDRTKYCFSFVQPMFSIFHSKIENEISRKKKMEKYFSPEFDELRWCVLIHFDGALHCGSSRLPAICKSAFDSRLTPLTKKMDKNTLINHSSVQFMPCFSF